MCSQPQAASAAAQMLLLLRYIKKKEAKNKMKAKVISFLNIFSFDYESERILSERGSSGRCSWAFAS